MRYGLTRRQWVLAAILAFYVLVSPSPPGSLGVAFGNIVGAVFFVWAVVMIFRAVRAVWDRTTDS